VGSTLEAWLFDQIRKRFAPVEDITVHTEVLDRGLLFFITRPDDVLRFAVSQTEVLHARDVYALFNAKLANLEAQLAPA